MNPASEICSAARVIPFDFPADLGSVEASLKLGKDRILAKTDGGLQIFVTRKDEQEMNSHKKSFGIHPFMNLAYS